MAKVKKIFDTIRKAQWFKMVSLFDGPSKKIAEVSDRDVLVRGVKYRATITCGNCGHAIKANMLSVKNGIEDKLELTPELALCVVPTAVLEEQGEALRLMLEANLRIPVILLTNNVHLVKLKPINGKIAKEIMERPDEPEEERSEPAKIIQISGKKAERSKEGEGGETGEKEG